MTKIIRNDPKVPVSPLTGKRAEQKRIRIRLHTNEHTIRNLNNLFNWARDILNGRQVDLECGSSPVFFVQVFGENFTIDVEDARNFQKEIAKGLFKIGGEGIASHLKLTSFVINHQANIINHAISISRNAALKDDILSGRINITDLEKFLETAGKPSLPQGK